MLNSQKAVASCRSSATSQVGAWKLLAGSLRPITTCSALVFCGGCFLAQLGQQCTFDEDCVSPLICAGQACVEGCRDDSECPVGDFCSAGLPNLIGRCVECTPDDLDNCQPDEVCGVFWKCAECRSHLDCPNPGSDICLFNSCVDPGARDPLVNSFKHDSQRRPSVAMSASGEYVVAWMSRGQDGSGSGVFARLFNAAGSPIGSEFRANFSTSGHQSFPAVAMAPSGDFVIIWNAEQIDGPSNVHIRGRGFDPAGTAQDFDLNIANTETEILSPASVAMDVNGEFVVAWHAEQDPYPLSVFAKRYFADGSPNGDSFMVSPRLKYIQGYPTVAMAPSGNFVVSWSSLEFDGSEEDVLAQRFDADANRLGAEFYANSYTTSAQLFSSVAMDSDGDFVIVWASQYQDGSSWGVFGQRFAADGTATGGEFQANTHTTSIQKRAEVAMDSIGNFVVTWDSETQDGSVTGIFARRFDAGGQSIGEEFQVNTFTASNQDYPALAVDADGDFVVAWQSNLLDGDFEGIAARLNPPALRAETLVAGSADHPAGIAGVGLSHTFATDPNSDFAFSTTDPGVSASQVLSFAVTEGDLEVYSVQWSYPEGFVFNGFTAAAPPDAAIGLYKIDLYNDGLPDFESPIRALAFQTAYVDVENDTDAAGDPVLVSLGGVGVNLVAYVPTGGDGDLGSITVSAGGRVSIELDAGVLTNPQQDFSQSLHLLLTSVDPDTGDYNDGQGEAPLTFMTQNPLSIGLFFTDGFESSDTSAWSSTSP